MNPNNPASPCIKCGACLAVCPAKLSPLRLYALWLDAAEERMQTEETLDACILCRKCDAVCPAELPLADSFAAAQKLSEQRRAQTANALRLRARHQNHLRRAAEPPKTAALNPQQLAADARQRAAEKIQNRPPV